MQEQQTGQQSKPAESSKKLLPMTYENLKGYFWKRPDNYHFAAKDILSELSVKEVPMASVNLPITFVQGKDQTYHLAMIQGFVQGENLLVSNEGTWLSQFVPSLYRFHPFVLLQNDQKNLMLYFDNSFSHLSKDPNAERFYDDDNQPVELIKQVFNSLVDRWQGVTQSLKLVKQLDKAGLITPWDITLQRNEGEVKVKGCFRIDEDKLSEISSEDLVQLRDSGALTLAYCQMLSMNKLSLLLQLDATSQQQSSPSTATESDNNLLFNHEMGAGLNFDNL